MSSIKRAVIALFFLFGLSVAALEPRDDCLAGSQEITQVTFGQVYEVCCPGTATSVGLEQFRCVGGNSNNKRNFEKRQICNPFCLTIGSDPTSSCLTMVPVTALDFSAQVSSATAVAATVTTPTMITTTAANGSMIATSLRKAGARAMISVPTAIPFFAGGALAVANAAMFLH